MLEWSQKKLRRIMIAILGTTVLAIGIAMIILPGPALVVIPAGIGILATEFVWARHLLRKVRAHLEQVQKSRNKNSI